MKKVGGTEANNGGGSGWSSEKLSSSSKVLLLKELKTETAVKVPFYKSRLQKAWQTWPLQTVPLWLMLNSVDTLLVVFRWPFGFWNRPYSFQQLWLCTFAHLSPLLGALSFCYCEFIFSVQISIQIWFLHGFFPTILTFRQAYSLLS